MNVIKIVLLLLLIAGAAAAGYCLAIRSPAPATSTPPLVERVRELSRLTTLEIPVSQIHTERIAGYTGSVSAVIVAHGEVVAGVAMDEARTTSVDRAAHQAVIELPAPELERPRLDQERTEIYRIDRGGLWKLNPAGRGERVVTNQALERAQARLEAAVDGLDVERRARERAEEVLRGFCESLGWDVSIEWRS